MTRKNTLKRVLMYVVVLVGVMFVGFMAFYFAKNDETIALTIDEGSIIYVNKGDVIALPIEHEDAHRGTTFDVVYSNENVVSLSFDLMTITASNGGATTITITPTNTNFGPFRFDVLVGEGTSENPWYVSTASQLASIGKPAVEGKTPWTSYQSYELINDINLSSTYTPTSFWSCIPEFQGTISGEGYTVSNLKVTGDSSNLGMFGTLSETARIEKISLTNVIIEATGSNYVGVVAGINKGFIGKVNISGALSSTNDSALVGGVVGYNKYEGSRPVLNMVSANITIHSLGTIGGLVGRNEGGIIFNSSSVITEIDIFEQDSIEESCENIFFGGVVGENVAIIYGTEQDFRQAAIKNVFVQINADNLLARNSGYSTHLALLAYSNDEITIDLHTYAVPNVFTKIYAIEHQSLPLFVTDDSAATASISILTPAQVANSESFDFSAAWTYDITLHRPVVNISTSYEPTLVSDPGEKIEDLEGVIGAFKNIIQNLDKNISYTVDVSTAENNEIVVDCQDILDSPSVTSWQPIGTFEQPYQGQFIVEGGMLVIENMTITNISLPYLGFFGYVSGPNTIIKNIAIRNVTILANENVDTTAGAFIGHLESGYVENVTVDNISITNCDTAGFAVGYSRNGILNNIKVGSLFEEGHENIIKYDLECSTELFYGGIIGSMIGSITSSSVANATIDNRGTVSSIIGGLVGKLYDGAMIADSSNQSLFINSFSGKGYYGGLVGYMNADTTVEHSYNLGDILVTIGEDESYAGGISGYVGENAYIKTSFSQTLSIQAKNVGGIVGINDGFIHECYSLGDYIGNNVGGLAYINKGEIKHVYTRATVKSISTSGKSIAAGLVVYIPKGGTISYAYSSASIQAPNGAKKFAETRSYIRYTGVETFFDDLFGGTPAGTIKNYIVINYDDAYIQSDNFNAIFRGIFGLPKGFIEADEEAVLGYAAVNPFALAGFQAYTPQFWAFEDGQWPTLTNVVSNPLEEDVA